MFFFTDTLNKNLLIHSKKIKIIQTLSTMIFWEFFHYYNFFDINIDVCQNYRYYYHYRWFLNNDNIDIDVLKNHSVSRNVGA